MKKHEQIFTDVKIKHDDQMKKQERNFENAERKFDNECEKKLYYYRLWKEKEEQFQKLLNENEKHSKLLRLEVSKHENVQKTIVQLEDGYRYLHGSYTEVQAKVLEQQNELDEVILHKRILEDKIKYLKTTHDEEMKIQKRKFDNECEKALYYYKLTEEKEKQYQEMIAEYKEMNDTNYCNTFFYLFILLISMLAFFYENFNIINTYLQNSVDHFQVVMDEIAKEFKNQRKKYW